MTPEAAMKQVEQRLKNEKKRQESEKEYERLRAIRLATPVQIVTSFGVISMNRKDFEEITLSLSFDLTQADDAEDCAIIIARVLELLSKSNLTMTVRPDV